MEARADAATRAGKRALGFYALLVLVYTIPLENVVHVPGVGSLARLAGIVAFALWAVQVLLRGTIRRPSPELLLPFLFLVWNLASAAWSLDPGRSAQRIQTAVQLMALIWLMWDQGHPPGAATELTEVYVAGCATAGALTLADLIAGGSRYVGRYAALGFDPNGLGVILALGLVFTLHFLLSNSYSRTHKAILVGELGLCGIGLVLTASRGAFLAAIVGLTVTAYTTARRGPGRLLPLLLLLGGLGVVSVQLVPEAILERLGTIPVEIERGTLSGRRQIWWAGFQVWLRRPLTGVGSGAFMTAVEPLLGRANVAHNTFLSILVETGIIGGLLFAAWVGLLFSRTRKLDRISRGVWSAAFATWATGALSLTWEFEKPTWFLLGLAMLAIHRMHAYRPAIRTRAVANVRWVP